MVFLTDNSVISLQTIGHCYEILNGSKTKTLWPCGFGVEGTNYYVNHNYLRAITQEALGTFIFVLFFMMQTDEKMLFSRERAINCFIIGSSYVAARAMFYGETISAVATTAITSTGAVLNPAISLGIMLGALFNGVSVGAGGAFMIWFIYPVMPILGAILSLLFFEFVYKKTQDVLEGDIKEEHTDDGLLDA